MGHFVNSTSRGQPQLNKRVFGLPLLLGVLALVSAPIGLAWACTQQSTLSLAPASSVPQKATLQVTAEGFSLGAPVEIRWNDVSGPVLARSEAGNFSVEVQVPEIDPGTYYIVAVSPGVVARAPVEVIGGAIVPGSDSPGTGSGVVASELWSGFLREQATSGAGTPKVLEGTIRTAADSIPAAALATTLLGGVGIALAVTGLIRQRAFRRQTDPS